MPPPPEQRDCYKPNYEHHLDDALVVVEDNAPWLQSCMAMVSRVMQAKGYQVLDKSILAPTTWVKWSGKEVDLDSMSISNSISVVTRIIACLTVLWGECVSAKDLMRVIDLIGWLGTPAKGHLPFLGGVSCALFWG